MRRTGALAIVLCVACDPAPVEHGRVLAYSRTLGYRHADAIDAAARVLPDELASGGLAIDLTEDPAAFSSQNLAQYCATVFLYTTGNDVVDADGKRAFESFVASGGGWVGLHSAADTEYAWPLYQTLVVAPFASHPAIQPATVTIEDQDHPATVRASSPWVATDEWYNFAANPRDVAGVRVLATIDETSYEGGTMGADHPVVWAHERAGGRAFYTELGHVASRWEERAFVEHVTGGIRWACAIE